jgi:hypothetical protein
MGFQFPEFIRKPAGINNSLSVMHCDPIYEEAPAGSQRCPTQSAASNCIIIKMAIKYGETEKAKGKLLLISAFWYSVLTRLYREPDLLLLLIRDQKLRVQTRVLFGNKHIKRLISYSRIWEGIEKKE